MTIRGQDTARTTMEPPSSDRLVAFPDNTTSASGEGLPTRNENGPNVTLETPGWQYILPVFIFLLMYVYVAGRWNAFPTQSMFGDIFFVGFLGFMCFLVVSIRKTQHKIAGDASSLVFTDLAGRTIRCILLSQLHAVYIEHYVKRSRDGPDVPRVTIYFLLQPAGETHTTDLGTSFAQPLLEYLHKVVPPDNLEESKPEDKDDFNESQFAQKSLALQQQSGASSPKTTHLAAQRRGVLTRAVVVTAIQFTFAIVFFMAAYYCWGTHWTQLAALSVVTGVLGLLGYGWIMYQWRRFRPPLVLTDDIVLEARSIFVACSGLHALAVLAVDEILYSTWDEWTRLWLSPFVFAVVFGAVIYTCTAFAAVAVAWSIQTAWGPAAGCSQYLDRSWPATESSPLSSWKGYQATAADGSVGSSSLLV